jgi:hypothetical protein
MVVSRQTTAPLKNFCYAPLVREPEKQEMTVVSFWEKITFPKEGIRGMS